METYYDLMHDAGPTDSNSVFQERHSNSKTEEFTKLRDIVSNYQGALSKQQEILEFEKKQHAFTVQSLAHKVQNYKANKKWLKNERAKVHDLIGVLNTFGLSKLSDLHEDPRVNTLTLEHGEIKARFEAIQTRVENLEERVKNKSNDVEHLRLLMEYLSNTVAAVWSRPTDQGVDPCDEEE